MWAVCLLYSDSFTPLMLRQGTGKVGGVAACLLSSKAGAVVICSDLVPGAVAAAVPGAEDGAKPFAPCARRHPLGLCWPHVGTHPERW